MVYIFGRILNQAFASTKVKAKITTEITQLPPASFCKFTPCVLTDT